MITVERMNEDSRKISWHSHCGIDIMYVLSLIILHYPLSGEAEDVYRHEDAVYGLSSDPVNDSIFASACADGRVLIYDIRAPPSEGTTWIIHECHLVEVFGLILVILLITISSFCVFIRPFLLG